MARKVTPGLERRLKAAPGRGRVRCVHARALRHRRLALSGDAGRRGAPRSMTEAEQALALARDEGVSVLPRGGGYSQAGQTVNSSLVIDCSKHLDRVLELDVAGRRCVVEPGIVLDELNRQLKPHGLWFPVDISTSSRATIGGMVGNNSCGALAAPATRENVISIDAVLADGAAHFGRWRPTSPTCPRPRRSPLARDLLALGAREADAIQKLKPARSAGSAATSTRWCPAATSSTSRISWSAPKERSASRPGSSSSCRRCSAPRGRRLPLRRFPTGDGRRAAHRQARADRGRADRSHHAGLAREIAMFQPTVDASRRPRGHPVRRVRRGRPRRTSAGCRLNELIGDLGRLEPPGRYLGRCGRGA